MQHSHDSQAGQPYPWVDRLILLAIMAALWVALGTMASRHFKDLVPNMTKLATQAKAHSAPPATPQRVKLAAFLDAEGLHLQGSTMQARVANPMRECSQELAQHSRESSHAMQLEFANHGQSPVVLWWIDYGGKRQRYATVRPGAAHAQSTFASHPWVVSDLAGKCLGLLVME